MADRIAPRLPTAVASCAFLTMSLYCATASARSVAIMVMITINSISVNPRRDPMYFIE